MCRRSTIFFLSAEYFWQIKNNLKCSFFQFFFDWQICSICAPSVILAAFFLSPTLYLLCKFFLALRHSFFVLPIQFFYSAYWQFCLISGPSAVTAAFPFCFVCTLFYFVVVGEHDIFLFAMSYLKLKTSFKSSFLFSSLPNLLHLRFLCSPASFF